MFNLQGTLPPDEPHPNPADSTREALAERLAAIQAELATTQAALAALAAPATGHIAVAGGEFHGVVAGLVLGNIIYGRDVHLDEQRRLVRYLNRVRQRYGRLSLRGLRVPKGGLEEVTLAQVYITLASTHRRVLAEGAIEAMRPYLRPESLTSDAHLWDQASDPRKADFHPDHALPGQAIVAVHAPRPGGSYDHPTEHPAVGRPTRGFFSSGRPTSLADATPAGHWRLDRAELVVEAVADHRRMILLGDPGSGKSVFLRQIAWDLAGEGRDAPGSATPRLPILLPLRRLAGALAMAPAGESPTATLTALCDQHARSHLASDAIDDIVREGMARGVVTLLLDGLDEVPLAATATSASRAAVVDAIAQASSDYPEVGIIVTSRIRAFDETIRARLAWTVRTLAPWTLGQIRRFLAGWYGSYQQEGLISADQGAAFSSLILEAVAANEQLHDMATTPLLLTLMAQIVYNDHRLPRDRPQLYERMLELLLGQWDAVQGGQDLAAALGCGWDSKRLRRLLDQLSYTAHCEASSTDGRGRLSRALVRDRLIAYFTDHNQPNAWALAGTYLDYIEQRSGLLVPDGPDDYVFAHLTFQEHCAGRYLVTHEQAALLVRTHRVEDRWREPLMLGLGVVQEHNPTLVSQILRDLIDPDEGDTGAAKPAERWYRDLILAAEVGGDREWAYMQLQGVDVGRLQRDLRNGLATLLGDRATPLPAAERVHAAFLLGELGDPRIPVTLDDWRREVAGAMAGSKAGYFCHIPAGTYPIGSREDDDEAHDNERPLHMVQLPADVWLARYPFTQSQWQALTIHGVVSAARHAGSPDLNRPTQPVVGVLWEHITAGLGWLSQQLGVTFRLPTEWEWEAAARGPRGLRYPWGNNWRADHAATVENQDTRGARWTTPVGCFPRGASPSGALDMAGNVWEWCEDSWKSYPGAAKPFEEAGWRMIRGGSYDDDRTAARGAQRDGSPPGYDLRIYGFRVCVELRTADSHQQHG